VYPIQDFKIFCFVQNTLRTVGRQQLNNEYCGSIEDFIPDPGSGLLSIRIPDPGSGSRMSLCKVVIVKRTKMLIPFTHLYVVFLAVNVKKKNFVYLLHISGKINPVKLKTTGITAYRFSICGSEQHRYKTKQKPAC
jgi:hypothetical protein